MPSYPNYLAAVHRNNKTIFVLAQPNLSAVKIDGEWVYREPLTDAEIEEFDLVTDLETARTFVEEATRAIFLKQTS